MKANQLLQILLALCLLLTGMAIIYGSIQLGVWVLSMILFHTVESLMFILSVFTIGLIVSFIRKKQLSIRIIIRILRYNLKQ